jgi:hypothetical protein
MHRLITIFALVLTLLSGSASAQSPVFQNATITNQLTVGANNTTTVRTVLTNNANYFVNANPSGTATCGNIGQFTCQAGSDSNNGFTAATPFQTLQHALAVAATNIDLNGFSVTINLAHGTSQNYQANCSGFSFVGNHFVGITGDSNAPAAVTIVDGVSAGYGIIAASGCALKISDVAFADSISTDAAGHMFANGGEISYATITLGGMASGTQMIASFGGRIRAVGNIAVTGGAHTMLSSSGPSSIDITAGIINITTPITYSVATAVMIDGGEIIAPSGTFTGSSATGTKCLANGISANQGYDCNTLFPGNAVAAQNIVYGMLQYSAGAGGGNPNPFSNLAACSAAMAGTTAYITDATVNTWGATISTGGGSNKVMGFCNSTNWTVFAK